MGDQKSRYESLPIPTYEEATSSRPSSSLSHLGPGEVGDDAERQGLLHDGTQPQTAGRPSGYHPPTVESARSSLDYLPSSSDSSERGSTENLRNELEQMEVEEPSTTSSQSTFSKRFTTFKRTLSSIHLPLRKYIPKFNFNFSCPRLPSTPEDQTKCILILRIVAVLILATVIYLLVASDIFSFRQGMNMAHIYDPEQVRIFVQSHINETNISENLDMLTRYPHIAGTEGNYVLAEWMEDRFAAAGLEEVRKQKFDVYLNYPREDGRRVAIVEPPEKAWEARLAEESVYKTPREQTLPFHGLSKSGNATGPLVYANYGSRKDFKTLADMGVDLQGAIALVRHYGSQTEPGLKVKAAELAGAAGCIIYSDPAEDGFTKGQPWPKGRYMPRDGVQRSSVSLMSWVIGDVLSPGFASLEDEDERIPLGDSHGLVNIPSIPLAWRDAQPLLQALKGHGNKLSDKWVGGVPDIKEWWTGDSSSPKVNVMNMQDEEERQPIYNVLGRIKGIEEPEKGIVIGTHRDAWCFGAASPGSGSAVLLEIARVFGELRALGWRPLRTIEFASWDGKEYNLIGSTEHVESKLEALRLNGYAYLNVDVAVSGDKFRASASPAFERTLLKILKRTSDPNSNQSLRSIWDNEGSKLKALSRSADYVPFQNLAGMSSIDIGFEGEPYPYHSCYDNFEWMSRVGDPGFQYHRVLGQVWALLLLSVSDEPVLPFDLEAYAAGVAGYVSDLRDYADKQGVPLKSKSSSRAVRADTDLTVDFKPLFQAADNLSQQAKIFSQWSREWNATLYGSGGLETNVMAIQRMHHNNIMAYFDTNLLDIGEDGGIPNRNQFKHIIYGPQAWSSGGETYFPAIRDAIESGNSTDTQQWVNRVSEILSFAGTRLNH